MSSSAKCECLVKIQSRYDRAGRLHGAHIFGELFHNCGYHRKAALRRLHRPLPGACRQWSNPKPTYDPGQLLPVLKILWLASDQLCSKLLEAELSR